MNKFWIVVSREYMTRIKKKSFLIFTLLTPFLLILFGVIATLLLTSQGDGRRKEIVVLDQTGKYLPYLKDSREFKFIKGDKELAEYRKENNEEIYAYVLIKDDLQSHPDAITIHTRKQLTSTLSDKLKGDLTPVVQQEKLDSYHIPSLQKIIEESKIRLDISTVKWAKDGKEASVSTAVAYALGQLFNVVIYMFIIMYGMMVMQGVREEKKNRVVEIIVSSVKPRTLLFGKVVGVGLIGFTQMLIWILLLLVGIAGFQIYWLGSLSFDVSTITSDLSTNGWSESSAADIQSLLNTFESINLPGLGLAFVVYFVLGYLLYASLYAIAGASIDNDEDVNQIIMPMTLIMVIGFYLGFYSANNPDSVLALWGSFIPFTSPMVMMVRLCFDTPLWQVLLSIVILLLSTALLIWFGSKIFRVGLLMYGKKPTFREIRKWMSYK